MTEAEKWFYGKKPGELLTQISKADYAELVQIFVAGEADIEALFTSTKKDRILAKRLLCLQNLAATSSAHTIWLLKQEWRTMYFKKAADGSAEVVVTKMMRGKRRKR